MKSKHKLTDAQWKTYWKNIGIGFYILVIPMMINAFVKEICSAKWANPMMETTILLLLPFLYITISNSLLRSYGSLKLNATFSILISLVIGVLLLVGSNYNAFKLVENGIISDSIWSIVFLSMWNTYYIACVIRILFRKKNNIYN
ncbi:MAG: hypothetical protein FWC41_13950 [Firmicutes bacterium]|nr:hypothetical protein [Bacillota bacterium]